MPIHDGTEHTCCTSLGDPFVFDALLADGTRQSMTADLYHCNSVMKAYGGLLYVRWGNEGNHVQSLVVGVVKKTADQLQHTTFGPAFLEALRRHTLNQEKP